jgi:uncharacterized DUF497 family protein
MIAVFSRFPSYWSYLVVLTGVHTKRNGATSIISFRQASSEEREVYDDWLENEYDEP